MHRTTRWPRFAAAGCAGVLAALGAVTGLTQAATTQSTTTTPTSTTSTTSTTKTTTTPTTTTPASASKPKATTKKVSCRAALVATKAPGGPSAENFGTITCAAPLGKGVHHDSSSVSRSSATAGSFAGPVKLFFNTGAIRGTYKLSFTIANKTITYSDGTMKLSSGTGAFAGVTGTGTIAGTSSDGVHSAITEKLTLKIPPKKA